MLGGLDPLSAARLAAAVVLIAAGLALILAGAAGLMRFPDFFTRLHAVSMSDGVGGALLALGLCAIAPDAQTAIKLALLALLIAGMAPTSAHLIANAAHAAGLAPLAGAYRAPRRGEASSEEGAS
jgi:multicomponent Na+:H+ antiporter subunit G